MFSHGHCRSEPNCISLILSKGVKISRQVVIVDVPGQRPVAPFPCAAPACLPHIWQEGELWIVLTQAPAPNTLLLQFAHVTIRFVVTKKLGSIPLLPSPLVIQRSEKGLRSLLPCYKSQKLTHRPSSPCHKSYIVSPKFIKNNNFEEEITLMEIVYQYVK